LNSYQRLLFLLLCGVIVIEGFDANVTNIVVPFLGKDFAAGPSRLGSALALISLGAVAGFFTIRLADRFGRRPILLGAVLGFSVLSLATTFVQSLNQFIFLQLCARICLVTQLATAYILLSEELPPRIRGRANGLMGAFATVGAALPAMALQPLQNLGHGWRELFVLGALPLLLLPWLVKHVRESGVYLADLVAKAPPSIASQFRALWAPHLRVRFIAMSFVWFIINFWSGASLFFFTYYVFHERGWTAHELQIVAPFGLLFSFLGYVGSGWLMDRIGRRWAATILLALGTVATFVCYSSTTFRNIGAGWVGLQIAVGIWPVAHVINLELFATEVRAAANGLCENLLGRWGFVIAPAVVGLLAEALGATSKAVVVLACVNLLAIPVLLWVLPETRNTQLQGMKP
jgi:MFS family permease